MNSKCIFGFGMVLLTVTVLNGCTSKVASSITAYRAVAPQIQLGMTKDQVLPLLEPTQAALPPAQHRMPEQYTRDGKRIEIYFFRSYSNYDDILTDDEFVPYTFEDGILTSIGWTALGGPKTQATPQPIQQINIIR